MEKIISAGIIIYRRTKEGAKYLLLYSGRDYWNFPKGHIEKDEASFQTALREIREETGLKPQELKFQSRFKTFERFTFMRERKRVFKIVILYLAETAQSEIHISSEHEGFGWFTIGEARKVLAKHPDTVRILESAHAHVHPRHQSSKTQMPVLH